MFCNKMYSQKKFEEHLQLCKINKPMIFMPSQNKYLQFKNLKNAIQHNFIVYADIESHNHFMRGYYLHCIDEKYSKN